MNRSLILAILLKKYPSRGCGKTIFVVVISIRKNKNCNLFFVKTFHQKLKFGNIAVLPEIRRFRKKWCSHRDYKHISIGNAQKASLKLS